MAIVTLKNRTLSPAVGSVGAIVDSGSAAEFGKFIADETEKWAKVVKFAGIKAE